MTSISGTPSPPSLILISVSKSLWEGLEGVCHHVSAGSGERNAAELFISEFCQQPVKNFPFFTYFNVNVLK
jgi:hypothetical protein